MLTWNLKTVEVYNQQQLLPLSNSQAGLEVLSKMDVSTKHTKRLQEHLQ